MDNGRYHIAGKEVGGAERSTNRLVVDRLRWQCTDRTVEEGTEIGKARMQGKVVSMCCNEASWARGIVRNETESVELGGAKLVHLRGWSGELDT